MENEINEETVVAVGKNRCIVKGKYGDYYDVHNGECAAVTINHCMLKCPDCKKLGLSSVIHWSGNEQLGEMCIHCNYWIYYEKPEKIEGGVCYDCYNWDYNKKF